MLRLGFPVDRIAKRLNVSQKTVVESSEIIQSVEHDLKKDMSVPKSQLGDSISIFS